MTVVTVYDFQLAMTSLLKKTSASNTNDRLTHKPIGPEPHTKPKAIGNSIVGMYPSVFNGTAFRIDHIRLIGSMDIFRILGRKKSETHY